METGIKMGLPLLKNNSSDGFSILGLLITAAIMSGAALVAMQMTKTQTDSSTFTAAKLDEGEIKRQITLVLQDSIACKKTFDLKNIGSDLNAISNANNTPIFSLGVVADTKITITSLKTIDLNVFTPTIRDVDLVVGVSKVVSGREIKSNFNIPLKVKATGPTAAITDCFSDTSGIILAASTQSCTSLGGSWNAVTLTCALNNKIKKSGDTMTGGLIIASGGLGVAAGGLNINSGNSLSTNGDLLIGSAKKICVGTSCQDFSPKTCPPNEVAVGIKADGDLNCLALATQTLPTPVNCLGNWGACSKSCGGGTQTYLVTSPASNGGSVCPFSNGTTRTCNTQVCVPDVNCAGSWGSCSQICGTGKQTFTVTKAAQGNGTQCPIPLTRDCNTRDCNCERFYKYVTPDWKTYGHLCPKLPPSTWNSLGALKFKSPVYYNWENQEIERIYINNSVKTICFVYNYCY